MSDILHETESLCPVCLKRIPARYERIDGKAYMLKTCPEHGDFRVLFWRDADMYERWLRQGVHSPARERGKPESRGCPYDCGLCDEHRSGTCTSILEITYRCNMNCAVCFADANAEKFEPDLAQIRKMYAAALGSNPYCSVQLSGGEPTMRDDLPEIVRLGRERGFSFFQLNTNGLRLASEPDYAAALREAGVSCAFLQFDGLRPASYEALRGLDISAEKLRAIDNCAAAGLPVVLVPTLAPGVNEDEIGGILRFALARGKALRGVHFQPVSYFGRFPGQTPPDESRCGLSDVLHALVEQCPELKMEHFVPRKQFDPHCDFSSTYYLDEGGRLVAMSRYDQNDEDTERTDFVQKTNKYTVKRWKGQEERVMDTPLMRFAERTLTHSFCISGMGFQDVWNIDLGRLHGCCVHIITGKCEVIPFCAFHLTGVDGKRLYTN